MFLIDKQNNSISKIASKTFYELGFKERDHLQEWIAKNPECLDEELLIIQKEFDGFNDTNERLDLLALDKTGALVVIENKLDDTGKDVVWQIMKYVSYCSTLTKQQIVDIYQAYLDKSQSGEKAVDNIVDFMDGKPFEEIAINDHDQRMILVAGNFRKEVTSTVMWMINHGISVQCFKVTPYQHGEEFMLDIEQIIPVKETEEYIIKMADKAKEAQETKESSKGIEMLRKKFWSELLESFNTVSKQFQNINPTTDHWLSSGSGVSGIPFQFLITTSYVAVQLNIAKPVKEDNKKIYEALHEQKDKIEAAFGEPLQWMRLDDKKSSRILYAMDDVDIKNPDDWDKMKIFLCKYMPLFEAALKTAVNNAAKKIN